MRPTHFLVTGCARSGTGYVATALTALGVPCGHERVFCPKRLEGRDEVVWPDELTGESSWLAAPFVGGLPEEVRVFHQVREPVSFVRSKVRTRFFELPSWYKSFAERVRPALLEGDPVERSLRYWIEWNRMIEGSGPADAAPRRHRLEDLDAKGVAELLSLIGMERTVEDVARALEGLPRDYNTRGDRAQDRQLAWSDLPSGALRDEAREMATRYGYGDETDDGTLAV